MSRCLITGGAGFIGSHLAEALLAGGEKVAVIDNLSTGKFENIAHLISRPNFRFVKDSITDGITLNRLAAEHDRIYHLAGVVGVDLVVADAAHTIRANVMGTEAVLKAARRHHNQFILASSSEVYGKGSKIPFSEEDDIVFGSSQKSRWSYGASKLVEEQLALAYHHQHGLPVILCRLFNTIGPRQVGNYGMVVPRLVKQALGGRPLTVYGDGNQSRCFCDVDDVTRALILLSTSTSAIGKIFNVGSADEISILDLAKKILTLTGNSAGTDMGTRIQFIPYERAYKPGFEDTKRRVPDLSRIKTTVGWEPRIPLDATLRKILEEHMSFESLPLGARR